MATTFGHTRCRSRKKEHCYGQVSIHLSIAGLTHHDGGGHTGRGKGAGSVTEDSSRATWLQQARSHLRNADPVLARLIDDRPAFDPRAWLAQLPPMDLYGALLFQVTGQQLSVPATRRTLGRGPRPAPPGRPVLAEDRHPARPGRATVGRPAEPRRAERPAR